MHPNTQAPVASRWVQGLFWLSGSKQHFRGRAPWTWKHGRRESGSVSSPGGGGQPAALTSAAAFQAAWGQVAFPATFLGAGGWGPWCPSPGTDGLSADGGDGRDSDSSEDRRSRAPAPASRPVLPARGAFAHAAPGWAAQWASRCLEASLPRPHAGWPPALCPSGVELSAPAPCAAAGPAGSVLRCQRELRDVSGDTSVAATQGSASGSGLDLGAPGLSPSGVRGPPWGSPHRPPAMLGCLRDRQGEMRCTRVPGSGSFAGKRKHTRSTSEWPLPATVCTMSHVEVRRGWQVGVLEERRFFPGLSGT